MKKPLTLRHSDEPEAASRPNGDDRRGGAPKELRWEDAVYLPLPPSPPTWEVDGRDEFNRLYRDPETGPLLHAGFRKQYAKVVKLAATLAPEQRTGTVGAAIAKAYRRLVSQRLKAGQHRAAAAQYIEMFERVPADVEPEDKLHFNRVLAEMDRRGRSHDFAPIEDVSEPPLFTISESVSWRLEAVLPLGHDERPDSDARVLAQGEPGTWLLTRAADDGTKDRRVLRRVDRLGRPIAEARIDHDVYRSGTPCGAHFALMDSAGGLHVYDERLNVVVERRLDQDPRVVEHFRTVETNYWGEFKSQVRAIDVAPDGRRYMFTLADEAWCCALDGRTLWGVRIPVKDGWERVVTRSRRTGIAREVEQALQLLDLGLPVRPEDIRRQYRKLVFAHHPDRNPGDPTAEAKTKALGHAFEILTGVDPASLELGDASVTTFVRRQPDAVIETAGIRLTITLHGESAQDWIYAATFASSDGGAYLATYSGRVILLSNEGAPVVVFDIGTCPDDIVEAGRYLYLLTRTRLYVIEDRRSLVAFLDVFQQGRLVVTEHGFVLLTANRVQWFAPDGSKLGELHSHDPVRAVHGIEGGTVVKTRRHAAVVRGLVL